jgi:hypothetical protein
MRGSEILLRGFYARGTAKDRTYAEGLTNRKENHGRGSVFPNGRKIVLVKAN